jgi:hypothetical protein
MNSQKQNREYRIVLAGHEEILSNMRVKIRSELTQEKSSSGPLYQPYGIPLAAAGGV